MLNIRGEYFIILLNIYQQLNSVCFRFMVCEVSQNEYLVKISNIVLNLHF